MRITLIYCANGNKQYADIARANGYKIGSQLPRTVYHKLYFADQDWKRPNRERYIQALSQHRPKMATVLDWEVYEQLPVVLNWAEEASQFTENIIIIPKVVGGIQKLPKRINSKLVVLGYSVPTKYSGTQVPVWEFAGWPIHLLGGSPQRQMFTYKHLVNIAEVVSVDGNYAQKMAGKTTQFYQLSRMTRARNQFWPTLAEADGFKWGQDAIYEAFRRSCENIRTAWEQICSVDF